MLSEDQIYDFCLDWQMNQISKQQLIKEFKSTNWNYAEFENLAKKRRWFVVSMKSIKNALAEKL